MLSHAHSTKGLAMKDLQEATEKICLLKGQALAMECLFMAILRALPETQLRQALHEYDVESDIVREAIEHMPRARSLVLSGFETFFQRVKAIEKQ